MTKVHAQETMLWPQISLGVLATGFSALAIKAAPYIWNGAINFSQHAYTAALKTTKEQWLPISLGTVTAASLVFNPSKKLSSCRNLVLSGLANIALATTAAESGITANLIKEVATRGLVYSANHPVPSFAVTMGAIGASAVLFPNLFLFIESPTECLAKCTNSPYLLNWIGDNHFSKRDYEKALRWYRAADEVRSGNPSTLYNIGLCYELMRDANPEMAGHYYKRPELSNDPDTMNRLAKLFERGALKAVPPKSNQEVALEYHQKAANLGHAESKRVLSQKKTS